MNTTDKQLLEKIANTIRVLSAEGVEKANSGHPGLPMGCADLGATLFARHLRYNPKNPTWIGRDRFILSAGHGSMFIYSLLHLSGYDLSLDELAKFRQVGSKTPGHPEFGETDGVETTTGPLGQGIAAGVGMALAQKMLGARFGNELFDSKVFVLCGDGCMMEGISSEASSLAGHLALNNFVIVYDSNDICLDGPTTDCFSEDTGKRYEAYGFRVIKVDGHDFEQIDQAFAAARAESDKPVLIVAKTKIGKGSPNKQGKNAAHGAPLGKDEVTLVKQQLGWPETPFFVPAEVSEFFAARQGELAKTETEWQARLAAALQADPEKAKLWDVYAKQELPADFEDQVWNHPMEPGKATRSQSQAVIAKVASLVPYFVTSSADLSSSDNTSIKGAGSVSRSDFSQRVLKFGVREFAMATACYGMRLTGMLQPLCGTFFTFSDYMRNAVRLAAIMKQRVLFQFTHDSIFVGEDGPTHQPIEHVAALRAIPGVTVIRPCDEFETKAMWIQAFKVDGPVAFILSRQNMKDVSAMTSVKARQGLARGAYVLCGKEQGPVDVQIYASGSEVGVAIDAAKILEEQGKTVQVVSMPSWELFEAQDKAYKKSILNVEAKLRVSIEAGSEMGWHKYIGREGLAVAINRFGISGPAKQLAEIFGFTGAKVAEQVVAALEADRD